MKKKTLNFPRGNSLYHCMFVCQSKKSFVAGDCKQERVLNGLIVRDQMKLGIEEINKRRKEEGEKPDRGVYSAGGREKYLHVNKNKRVNILLACTVLQRSTQFKDISDIVSIPFLSTTLEI